jgi:hypothetical protein
VYASVEGNVADSPSDVKQLDTQLEHGNIYSHKLNFFHTPMPEVTVLHALNYLDTKNATTTGKNSFAVMNRKDSRKTAKEMEVADESEQKITSASMATLSEFLREVFTFSWQIVQSQAAQDLIDFIQIPEPTLVGQEVYVNDFDTINQTYDIRPAGDDDIIKAQEEIAKMQQDWPVVQMTPLKDLFYQDYMALRYPEKAEIYIPVLQAADPKQLVQSLLVLVENFASPTDMASLNPQEQQQLLMIKQQAMQYIGVSNAAQQTVSASGGNKPGTESGNPGGGSIPATTQGTENQMAPAA